MSSKRSSWNLAALADALGWRREEMPDVERRIVPVAIAGDLSALTSPLDVARAQFGVELGNIAGNVRPLRVKVLAPGGARVWGFGVATSVSILAAIVYRPDQTPPAIGGPTTVTLRRLASPGAANVRSVVQHGLVAAPYPGTVVDFGRRQVLANTPTPFDLEVQSGSTIDFVNVTSGQGGLWDLQIREKPESPFAR